MSEFEQLIHLIDTSSTARLIVIAIFVLISFTLYILFRAIGQSSASLKLVDSVSKANAATAVAQTATITSLTELYGKMQTGEKEQSAAITAMGSAIDEAGKALRQTLELLQTKSPLLETIRDKASEIGLWVEAIWNQIGVNQKELMERFDSSEHNILAAIHALNTDDNLDSASAWIEFDEIGNVVDASAQAQKVLGLEALTAAEFREFRRYAALIDIDSKPIPDDERPVTLAISSRKAQSSRFTGMRYKQHPLIWLLISVDVKADLVPARVVAQLTDITKVMRLIERARRAPIEAKPVDSKIAV